MNQILKKVKVKQAELEPDPIPEEDVIEGSPLAEVKVLFEDEERDTTAGIWGCSPGRFNWEYEKNETFAIYEGKAIVNLDSGNEIELEPGDTTTIPRGSSVTWNVKKTIRKAFVLH